MEEIWKPMFRFPEHYEVSNFGNVRRIKRGKKLTPEKVRLAKTLLAEGSTLQQTAKIIGVSTTVAWQIRKGLTWRGNANYRPLKTKIGRDFYHYVIICVGGVYTHVAVHRAVWEAVCQSEIPEGMQINHIDNNRDNNHYDNLEAVTPQENIHHAIEIYGTGAFKYIRGPYHGQK